MAMSMSQEKVNERLIKAIKDKDIKKVKELVAKGADVNYQKHEHSWSHLMQASYQANHELMTILLDFGADVNFQNISKDTALIKSLPYGDAQTIKLLVDAGADVQQKNVVGESALASASYHNRIKVIPALLELGADVNERGRAGRTAIMWASSKGGVELVKLLLKSGADISIKDDDGWTALMHASSSDHTETVQAFEDFIQEKELTSAAERVDDVSSVFGIGGR